jgi:hypothetical protein
MATSQPAKAKKKPKVEGMQQFNHRRSFTPKKPSFAVPMQGLKHIIFDKVGTAKVASTFNFNLKAISEWWIVFPGSVIKYWSACTNNFLQMHVTLNLY